MTAQWTATAPGAAAVPGLLQATPFAHGPDALRETVALLVDLDDPAVAGATRPLSVQAWALARAGCLSPTERKRAERFVAGETARRWVAARVVLRHLLGERLHRAPDTIRFDLGPHGKPELSDNATVSFSLSHAGPFVLVALAPGAQLGIDVEAAMDERAASEVAGALHPEERASLGRASGPSLCMAAGRAWVRKEAYLKALGTGLLRDPSLDLVGTANEPLLPASAPACTAIADLPAPPSRSAHVAVCAIDRTGAAVTAPSSASSFQ